MVHSIVMNESRQMDELDHCSERKSIVMRILSDLTDEEEEGGAEQLSPHPEKIVIYLLLEIEIGKDDSSNLIHHPFQPILHRFLNACEPGDGRGERRVEIRHEKRIGRGSSVRSITADS
jgi:hypothetical protein